MKKSLLSAFVLTLVALTAQAQVNVTAPWVRATVPAQSSTGAFMHLQSVKAARLVSVSSPVATTVELHKMEMKDSIMKMGPVEGIDLPAGKGVNLASGGYHIMLTGLKKQLKEGEVVPLTLDLVGQGNQRERVTVKVPVKPMTFAAPHTTKH